MSNRLQYAVRTHQGYVRSNNEDNYYVNGQYKMDVFQNQEELNGIEKGECFLAAVCDGMGGEENGELASLEVVKSLKNCDWFSIYAAARESITCANNKICEMITKNGGKRSGSTLAALYIDQGKAMSCNLGDSRVYLFRNQILQQISTDHTMADKMVRTGLMSKEQAKKWSGRHQITQYLGIFEEEMILSPAFCEVGDIKKSDIFLLCSDGLTDMVLEEEIVSILSKNKKPVDQVEQLVQEALKAGGKDNVTVIVVLID